ncbi:orotate phosphoribosyltransferase [Bacillus sp. FJAT-45037]|uniref:orotate phosphoribosyltransferase n=1 Tax=Bacillus sp. FJAT-45037 TaxID=2011007 RepID=UPI0012FD55C0|nr:orotate phosphoribosyltransferase [Bacillus sp. FJAT-45037]
MNKQIAASLLDIEAVALEPTNPFTWSSGLKSPIYCDNRMTLSYPNVRRMIAAHFKEVIESQYPDAEVIAGTATAGIPHAAWVSELLNLPMVYVRGSAKGHGKQNQIEGKLQTGQKVVIIEDLISTGGSAIKAAEALREAGANVLGIAAIFTYELPIAEENFKKENLSTVALTTYSTLLAVARGRDTITEEELLKLEKWRQNPASSDWMTVTTS